MRDNEYDRLHNSLTEIQKSQLVIMGMISEATKVATDRLDAHAKEDRQMFSEVWKRLGAVHNRLIWISGIITGAVFILKFLI